MNNLTELINLVLWEKLSTYEELYRMQLNGWRIRLKKNKLNNFCFNITYFLKKYQFKRENLFWIFSEIRSNVLLFMILTNSDRNIHKYQKNDFKP